MLWGVSGTVRSLLTLWKCRENIGLQLQENCLVELGIRHYLLLLKLLAVCQEVLLHSTSSLKMFQGIYCLKGVCITIIFILTLLGKVSPLISQFHPQFTSPSQDWAVFKVNNRFVKHHLNSGLCPKLCKEQVTCKPIHKTILASMNNLMLLQLSGLETSSTFCASSTTVLQVIQELKSKLG